MSQPASHDGRLFWAAIFPDAMALFQARSVESAAMQRSQFRIRDQQDWNGVETRLQAAQNFYIHAAGFKGWVRRSRRAMADNSHVAVQATKLVPGIDMTTSVVNVVQGLLEAVQNAAEVRQEILDGFNKLGETFDDINFVFEMFPQDPTIKEASVGLVATILDTVEKVIRFYNKRLPRKALAAYFKSEGYEHGILQGMRDIKDRSERLACQKTNADMVLSRQEARTQTKIGRETLEVSRLVEAQTSNIENKLEEVRDSNAALHNIMLRLLDEAEKNKILTQRNAVLEQTLRARTPTPSMSASPMPTMNAPTAWAIAPDALWALLGIPEEIDKTDMRKIEARQESFPWVDRGRFGHIVSMQRFQSWIVSPHPATLLIQGRTSSP